MLSHNKKKTKKNIRWCKQQTHCISVGSILDWIYCTLRRESLVPGVFRGRGREMLKYKWLHVCVFHLFPRIHSPRVSQDSDDGSKLRREEGLLELQRPAVEMPGWQWWQSRMLPEVPEGVWGKLSGSVGKLPRLCNTTLAVMWKDYAWAAVSNMWSLFFYVFFQVKYFTKRRDFLKYKEKMETAGFTPAEGPGQPS